MRLSLGGGGRSRRPRPYPNIIKREEKMLGVWKGAGADTGFRKGGGGLRNTLRCCTPAMGRSKAPAMYQNRMRCAAMHFLTCW